MTQQPAIREQWTRVAPGRERPRAMDRLTRVSGHGVLWGLLGLTGLGLFALAVILLFAPRGYSPVEQAHHQAGQMPERAGTQDPAPGPGTGETAAPSSPQPIQGADPVPALAPDPVPLGPTPSPTLDFENASGRVRS